MSSTDTPAPIDLVTPDEKLDLALKVAENVPVESRAFDDINFVESQLWIQALRLVNDHGIPQGTDQATRTWAERSFRLNESTQQAKALREGRIDRAACMEINRRYGSVEMLASLQNLYLLLQDFHLSDIEVSLPENDKALDRLLLEGARLAPNPDPGP